MEGGGGWREVAAIAQWLRQTWVQLPLVSVRVISDGIWPKQLPSTNKSPIYLGRHVRALEQGSE